MPFTISIKRFSIRWRWEDITDLWKLRVSTVHHLKKLPTAQSSQAHVSRKSKQHQFMKASYILWPSVSGELIICFFWWRELEMSLPTAASYCCIFLKKIRSFMFRTQSILKPTGVNHKSELFHLAFTSIMIYFSCPHSFNFTFFQEYNSQILFLFRPNCWNILGNWGGSKRLKITLSQRTYEVQSGYCFVFQPLVDYLSDILYAIQSLLQVTIGFLDFYRVNDWLPSSGCLGCTSSDKAQPC